ncbi:MAG: ATP synthase subunit C [Oscillospiraceae bacterium]|nr:ATPase [Oscillospiraceae bacterium]MCR4759035.1 ATP synthase subunit C [Oscillospiraceae bacterium]
MSVFEVLELILLPLLITALLALPVYAAITKKKDGRSMRRAMITNLCAFGAVMLCAIALPIGGFVSAAEATEAAATAANSAAGLGYLAAALAVGVGSIGCGIAVGHAAPAAIGALAEEPKSFAKALIFVALGEGVAIYGTLIAIMILSKL